MANKVLEKIFLSNFRKLKNYLLEFSEVGATVILAPNASGKTSILEAILVLATGESFRADKVEEMVAFDEEIARVAGIVRGQEDGKEERLEVTLTRGIVGGKKTQSRLYSLNQARKRQKDYVGKLGAVCFRPEDMRLIEGSPGRRRRFLDAPLSLIYPEKYGVALKNYEQTLRRRNKLLGQIKDGSANRETLAYWDKNLILNGEIVQQFRRDFLAFWNQVSFPLDFQVEYDQSLISEERLAQYAEAEIGAGHTLVGPHKDDFIVNFDFGNDKNKQKETETSEKAEGENRQSIATYGSRGQQRLAVLWLKLCELKFYEWQTGQKPVLLLDDIMSELDDESKSLVLDLISDHQTIVTTTEAKTVQVIEARIGKKNLETVELRET